MSSSTRSMSVVLQGAPDVVKRQSGAETRSAQVMYLDMTSEILDDMLAAARKGKQPQIAFGRSPMLTFGSRSLNLAHTPTKIRPEMYKINDQDCWSYAGQISHKLSVQRENDPSAGLDEALQMLKNNMATIEKEREARKTVTPANREAASKYRALPIVTDTTKQSSESHRGSADWALKHKIPAIRNSLIHILAIGPATIQECSKKSCASQPVIEPILEKIANKDANDEWELGNKAYKEVKPWSFRFSSEQRESIVERATKAFDRLRIDAKDPLWQDLLPRQERNKGIVLSRLAFISQGLTPTLGAKVIDTKPGLLKKSDTRKLGDLATKEKASDRLSPHPHKSKDAATKPTKVNGSHSKDDVKHVNHMVEKAEKAAQSPAHRPVKDIKPSMPAKALLNKPRNPSPLSKSPPVNASDFGDDHPVRRTFSAAPSPSRNGVNGSTKRKAKDSVAEQPHELSNKKARVEALHAASRTDRSSPAIKRKVDDHQRSSSSSSSDNTPLSLRRPMTKSTGDKRRVPLPKIASTNGTAKFSSSANRPRTGATEQHVSDDSSVTSPDYVLSHSRRLQMAEDFKRLYSKYKQLHMELSARSEAPSKDQMGKLMEMHNRVADMKKSLAT